MSLISTTLNSTTIAVEDATKGSFKIGPNFTVSRDSDSVGIVNANNVNADIIYLRDGEGNNIKLSADTVNTWIADHESVSATVDEQVVLHESHEIRHTASEAAIAAGVTLTATNTATIIEHSAAISAGAALSASTATAVENILLGSPDDFNSLQELYNAFTATDESQAATIAGILATATANSEKNIVHDALHSGHTTEATRAKAAEDQNAAAIETEATTARAAEDANAAAIAANTALITTNTSGVSNINKVVPGFTGTDYDGLTPLPKAQNLSPDNASVVEVKILLHLGPVWKLVCVDNNANHITFLQLTDGNDGSTLNHYNVSSAVEMSALYGTV